MTRDSLIAPSILTTQAPEQLGRDPERSRTFPASNFFWLLEIQHESPDAAWFRWPGQGVVRPAVVLRKHKNGWHRLL